MNRERLGQIRLPSPEDTDPHPRLLLNVVFNNILSHLQFLCNDIRINLSHLF